MAKNHLLLFVPSRSPMMIYMKNFSFLKEEIVEIFKEKWNKIMKRENLIKTPITIVFEFFHLHLNYSGRVVSSSGLDGEKNSSIFLGALKNVCLGLRKATFTNYCWCYFWQKTLTCVADFWDSKIEKWVETYIMRHMLSSLYSIQKRRTISNYPLQIYSFQGSQSYSV